jgi:hypothetical protein
MIFKKLRPSKIDFDEKMTLPIEAGELEILNFPKNRHSSRNELYQQNPDEPFKRGRRWR